MWLIAGPVVAVTIRIDYSYDAATSRFFSTNNPQGAAAAAQATAALNAAAVYFSNILSDSFSPITVPDTFESEVSNGIVNWEWTRSFHHPSTGNLTWITHSTPNQTTVAANDYVIYAGARNLSGNTLGSGGTGGCGVAPNIPCWRNIPSGNFSPSENNEIQTISSIFGEQVVDRGQAGGYANWGGSITFDSAPPAPWHYNHTTPPSGTVSDFYSVAVHELAHALGFGTSADWQSFVSGSSPPRFYGSNASALYGNAVPLNGDQSHWASNTTSVVYGTSTPQEAAMDPSLTQGTRKYFTALDAAAMKDIGWTVVPPPGVYGDYNNNSIVDAADFVIWRKRLGQSVTIPNDATPGTVSTSDYTVWRNNFGDSSFGGSGALVAASAAPEPGAATLALFGCAAVVFARRRRRARLRDERSRLEA